MKLLEHMGIHALHILMIYIYMPFKLKKGVRGLRMQYFFKKLYINLLSSFFFFELGGVGESEGVVFYVGLLEQLNLVNTSV